MFDGQEAEEWSTVVKAHPEAADMLSDLFGIKMFYPGMMAGGTTRKAIILGLPCFVALVRKRPADEVCATECLRRIKELAEQLARFFPEKSRWHWKERLEALAVSGRFYIKPASGRPTGSGRWRSREDFVAALQKEVAAISRRDLRPTQERVAGRLGTDDHQLRRWLTQYGIQWDEDSIMDL